MIKAVVFDYGGVLSPGGAANAFVNQIAETLGLPRNKIDIWEYLAEFRMGLIDEATCIEEVHLRYPDRRRLSPDMFLEGSGLTVRNEAMYDLVRRLRAHDIRTGILSDVYPPTAEMIRSHGNYDGFDPLVLSCNEHLRKPDAEFYKIVLQRLTLPAHEIIYIDDQQKFVEPARELGMKAIHHESPEQTIADVERLIADENALAL